MATDSAGAVSSTSARQPLRVLVAWNPTSSGDEAIAYAAWLARSMPVRIRVISILLRPWPATSLAKLGGKYQKSFNKEAKACATAVEEALTQAEIPSKCWDDDFSVFADGSSPAPILTEAAKDFAADLVIVGSSASTPKGRFHSSSTTSALLHSSPSPLGLAPRATKLSKHGITRLNYAFLESGEETSQVGLLYAASLANKLSLPLRIVAFSPTGLVDIPVTIKKSLVQDLTDQWHENALAMLDRARDRIMDCFPDITVETGIGSGDGWKGAIDALKWKKGDLLCLDSSDAGPSPRVFIGSPTSEFLQNIRVPAVVLPAGYERQEQQGQQEQQD
ncbi:universal stress protein [Corynebacterium pseudodiphtheriticum]|uniref:universal stress protein n=1 Tax=Corynebacterium pseudodiphtheriticum TaxID=37637 RepID=UPI00254C2BEB|nr:universal stress protein [Corynebacterium pseudodiphtheriticum]MDK8709176.1 universal stress protein [Corynebacterium pseudodiphtheriticum]